MANTKVDFEKIYCESDKSKNKLQEVYELLLGELNNENV